MKFIQISIICSLLLMGCSSSRQTTQQPSQETLPQSDQEYIEQIKQETEFYLNTSQSAMDSLDIKQCSKLKDENVQQACEIQLIMTMSAAGDKSLCHKLEDSQDKELCLQ